MNDITAYFVGGPKHGDIDTVRGDAHDIRIPVTDKVWMDTLRYHRDMGHYRYATEVRTGRYVQQHELYGMPDAPGSRRNYLYMWAGVA